MKIIDENVLSKFQNSCLTDGTEEEKRAKIYPITEFLEARNGDLSGVAELLYSKSAKNQSAYQVIKMPLNGSGQKQLFFLPPDIFDPRDPWGEIFREGLCNIDFQNKIVCNVGGGSGAEIIELLSGGNTPKVIIYNDINEHAMRIAKLNISLACQMLDIKNIEIYYTLGDAVRMLSNLRVKVDYMIGCLPQVPAHGQDLSIGQAIAHQYSETSHPELKKWGLGLIADVKKAAKKSLTPNGKVILTHSGRVPIAARTELDNITGYQEIRIIFEKMVRHHPFTPLEYLYGCPEALLFSDIDGKREIPPKQAENKRLAFINQKNNAGAFDVYHKVLIIESEPI